MIRKGQRAIEMQNRRLALSPLMVVRPPGSLRRPSPGHASRQSLPSARCLYSCLLLLCRRSLRCSSA